MVRRKGRWSIGSIVLLAVMAVTLLFIWSNSLDSIPESREKSLLVMKVLRPFLEVFVGVGNVTDHMVRKLAHFGEFGLLGCELMLFVRGRRCVGVQSFVNCLFVGFLAAAIDETIQIFSHRGSQLQDVWLDFAGAAAGLAFVLLASSAVYALGRKTCKKR